MIPSLASSANSVFSKQQALDWFKKNYPKIKPATVAAHLIRLSTNAPSRIHFSAKAGEDDALYQIDRSHFRPYQPGQDPTPVSSAQLAKDQDPVAPTSVAEEDPLNEGATEFAYETDLRNYLAKNLNVIEAGLRLYEEEGIKGIEFPVGGRSIDILAVDATGGLVVLELKVSRAYDRVVGQLMRYMAWIQSNLADEGQAVRGIIVGREISEDLVLACSLIPGVRLYEYELSLTVKAIKGKK